VHLDLDQLSCALRLIVAVTSSSKLNETGLMVALPVSK